MKHTLTILFPLLSLLMCAACSSDNGDENSGSEITLDIPIDIYSANVSTATRAAEQGDPGNDVKFKAPLYLYVYAFVSENDGSDYELLTNTFTYSEEESEVQWQKRDEDTKDERWHKSVRVTFRISRKFDNTLGKSRVYAIASRTDLSGILPSVSGYTAMTDLDAMTLDFATLTQDKLKDIYSTPTNDHSTPVANTDNGIIVGNNNTLTCSAVKLYHVAAKADFTWEVPASLRPTVELQNITCTGLPTTCKVFEPTNNPTGTGKSVVLGVSSLNPAFELNEGNKWLGRAYTFILQPPSPGTVNYNVEFSGSKMHPDHSGSITPAASDYNTTFTGWYRVIADVQE